jgi:hypothetical protein
MDDDLMVDDRAGAVDGGAGAEHVASDESVERPVDVERAAAGDKDVRHRVADEELDGAGGVGADEHGSSHDERGEHAEGAVRDERIEAATGGERAEGPAREERIEAAAGGERADAADGKRADSAARDKPEAHGQQLVKRRGPVRRVIGWVVTLLAGLIVFAALVMPNRIEQVTSDAFLRIPVEGIVAAVVLLVMPPRGRRILAVALGVLLAMMTILNFFDIGFYAVLMRPFDPVLDWPFFGNGLDFVTQSFGRAGQIGAVVATVLVVAAVFTLMTLAVARLSRIAARHRTVTMGGVSVVAAVWVVFALLGAQLVPDLPVASKSTASLTFDRARQAGVSLRDEAAFKKLAAVDNFRDTPDDRLLTALRGKDIMLAYIESYGRTAVEHPEVAAALDEGTRRLKAAGFASRSGWLTSPTTGGGSWLAHSTLQSGLWINNQQRYRALVSSDRLTLTSAMRRANWWTVGMKPGNDRTWPEGGFYGFERVYDVRNLGYKGPKFGWSSMPDQYTLSMFQRSEAATAGRGPLAGEITFTSSHSPWAPVPKIIGWDAIGDGSVYHQIIKEADPVEEVWKDPDRVRASYRRTVEYSVESLVAYAEAFGNDNLVLIFLGDHQPAPIITGENASRDVPISIVARDPAVLDRIAAWRWNDGIRPTEQAPIWRMDAFRDKFLTAFGP